MQFWPKMTPQGIADIMVWYGLDMGWIVVGSSRGASHLTYWNQFWDYGHPNFSHFLARENGHFWQNCPFSSAKKWHFGRRNNGPKTKIAFPDLKECSNQKVEEKKQTTFKIKFYIQVKQVI